MPHRAKSALALSFTFFLTAFIFTALSYSNIGIDIYNEFIPGPTLLSPTTEGIVLTGKDYLEFRWERSDLVMTDHLIFKLYKGYNTTQANLILKQDIPTDTYPVKLPVSQFREGEVYTWVLIEVFRSGKKSDRSFGSFKIIKK